VFLGFLGLNLLKSTFP